MRKCSREQGNVTDLYNLYIIYIYEKIALSKAKDKKNM